MRLELTGRHITITPVIRRLTDQRLAPMLRLLNDSAVSAQVVLTKVKTRVHAEVRPHYWGSWAVGPEGLYFIVEEIATDHTRKATIRATARYFRFATQEVTPIVTLEKPCWGMTVSPDGRYLLYAQMDVRGSDLMLAEGLP